MASQSLGVLTQHTRPHDTPHSSPIDRTEDPHKPNMDNEPNGAAQQVVYITRYLTMTGGRCITQLAKISIDPNLSNSQMTLLRYNSCR